MSSALVLDHGMFPEVARRLAQEGYEVGYFSPWANAFPQARDMQVGTGIDGVTRANEPLRAMMEGPDLVVVTDLFLSDYAMAARALDLPVVGSGEGERIETDRWFLKEFLADNGLDVIKSVEIVGVEETYKYLLEHPDTFVKVSVFRGDMETRSAKTWLTEYHDFRLKVGELGKYMRFIVEDEIPDAMEIGFDGFWCDGELLTPFLVGAEIKDAGYIGYVCDDASRLPAECQAIIKALGKYFAKTQYRSFFSNEMRVLPDGTTYMTDATCRVPSPPGGTIMRACQNFGAVMRGLAAGKPVAPDFGNAEYLSEIILKSAWGNDHFLEVTIPKGKRDDYAFHNFFQVDGKVWIAPHETRLLEFGSALGSGSLEQATKAAEKAAEAADAHKLEYGEDTLAKAREVMELAAKMGYSV